MTRVRLHLHYGPRQPGQLDGYSPLIDIETIKRAVRTVADDPELAWDLASRNLDEFIGAFQHRMPIRIPAAVLLRGLPADYERALEELDDTRRQEYEPLYGEEVVKLRGQLDARLTYAGEPPAQLADEWHKSHEDMREARNVILHHVMTSTFRIVISRMEVDREGRPLMIITARDTNRQDETRLDVTYCFQTGEALFSYFGSEGSHPSSSLESHWHAHRRLRDGLADRSTALVHCHALRILERDKDARVGGRRIDDVAAHITTVTGVSRVPAFGLGVAEALIGGAQMAFRPGEGVWVSGPSARQAAEGLVAVIDEVVPDERTAQAMSEV